MNKLKVYVGGPHVFWPKHQQEAFYNTVEELSTRYNFEALVPKDGDVTLPDGEEGNVAKLATYIYFKNIEDIKQADVIIADITSFRGPSADAGTIYEAGYARALNKPVIMWTDDWQNVKGVKVPIDYFAKVHLMGYDIDGNSIEQFGLVDNLMIVRPWDLVHVSVEDAFAAAYNLMNSEENILTDTKKAYEEGAGAYWEGCSLVDNPYHPVIESECNDAWRYGFIYEKILDDIGD